MRGNGKGKTGVKDRVRLSVAGEIHRQNERNVDPFWANRCLIGLGCEVWEEVEVRNGGLSIQL